MFVSVTFPECSPFSQHSVLVDSGAAGNIINKVFLWLCLSPVYALDSRPLGFIREATAPLVTQGDHRERISLLAILPHSLGTPIVTVDMPFPVHALDSRPLGSGFIREVTTPLCMITREGHKEKISLFLIDSPAYSVVLGLPWLACHNHTVSWPQRALTGWS
jgi:hypothetical protein